MFLWAARWAFPIFRFFSLHLRNRLFSCASHVLPRIDFHHLFPMTTLFPFLFFFPSRAFFNDTSTSFVFLLLNLPATPQVPLRRFSAFSNRAATIRPGLGAYFGTAGSSAVGDRLYSVYFLAQTGFPPEGFFSIRARVRLSITISAGTLLFIGCPPDPRYLLPLFYIDCKFFLDGFFPFFFPGKFPPLPHSSPLMRPPTPYCPPPCLHLFFWGTSPTVVPFLLPPPVPCSSRLPARQLPAPQVPPLSTFPPPAPTCPHPPRRGGV